MRPFWAPAGASPSKHTVHVTSAFLYMCLFFLPSLIAPVDNHTAIWVLTCSLGKTILNSTSTVQQELQ